MNRKLISLVIVAILMGTIATKTITTFTLCGGSLMQNWLGFGACTDTQSDFNGEVSPFLYQVEVAGILFLIILAIS